MKKINSIGYGHKILAAAGVFSMALPAGCHLLFRLFQADTFRVAAVASWGIGTFILALFAGLLLLEFRQDAAIERHYKALKKTKMLTGNGRYECQSCGNRQVGEQDRECRVCGRRFGQEGRREK